MLVRFHGQPAPRIVPVAFEIYGSISGLALIQHYRVDSNQGSRFPNRYHHMDDDTFQNLTAI